VKYYVYYDDGSCHEGDHINGLDEYETHARAIARVEQLRRDRGDLIVVLIEGTDMTPRCKEGE
jgi:hypothetical protein